MTYVPKKDQGKQFHDENLTLVLTFRGVQYQITTRRNATFGYIRAEICRLAGIKKTTKMLFTFGGKAFTSMCKHLHTSLPCEVC